MSFKPLLKKHNWLKFEDKIPLENVFLVSKYFNNILPSIFDNCFTLCSDINYYNIAAFSTGNYSNPHSELSYHEKKSITMNAVNAWNKIKIALGDVILKN